MDKEQLLRLERAGVDLMSPPNAVSDERRKQAEVLFMELRNSKTPYNVCKFVLEHSQSDFVQFQAASTIQEASMREWSVLPVDEKTALRGYIVQYLTAHPNLVNYVRSQLLHTVALMVKRATLEDDRKKLFDSVLTTLSQLLASDDHKMRHLGCSLLGALLIEYSSSTGSSNISMPLEFHNQCKKAVEEEVLLRFLHITAQVLQHYLNADWTTLLKEDHALLGGFLNISSQLLNWHFQHDLDNMFMRLTFVANQKPDSVVLKPPRAYASTFLDPNFLLLFLKLLSKVRENEDQTHHVIQCLTQLASLSKPVFETDVERQTYLLSFVSGILEYVSASATMSQQEVYGLSCILRRLATTFSAKQFSELGGERLELLVRLLAQLTCLSAHKTVLEDEEEGLTYQESLEHFFEVWVSLLCGWTVHDPSTDMMLLDPSYKRMLTQPLVEVFNAYVQSKISAPRGWRVARDDDSGEIVEIEEDDRIAFADELLGIGYISRTFADHTIPILINLFDQCTNECLRLLVMVKQDAQVLNSQQNSLDSLYEDLHWLTLIAAYTLCEVEKGKVVYIPSEIMQYSIVKYKSAQTAGMSSDSNSAALLSGRNEAAAFLQGEGGGGGGVDLSTMDPIVALILSVCRLCNLEKAFVSNGLIEVLSPQLCDTVVWCLAQLADPYLMFDEQCYQEVSLPLTLALGRDSKSAEWLTVFLTEMVTFNLSVWTSEDKLCVSSVELFNSLVKLNTPRTAVVSQCDVVWSLMRSFSSGHDPVSSLPPKVQRLLMFSLLFCDVGERKQQFTTELLQPFQDRFMSLVHRDDFRSVCQDAPIQRTILGVLDALCGLVEARRPEQFHYLLPFLQVCVSLMEVYSGVSEVITIILKLFSLVAEYSIVWQQADCHNVDHQICSLSLGLIQAYAKKNIGKYSKLAIVEEEQCEDLLLFVELLGHHTTMVEEMGERRQVPENSVQLSDVIMNGVCLLLSFVNGELLKFPTLCEKIFSLLSQISKVCPNVIATLSNDTLFSFVRLVELGLTNYGSEVCQYSLESVCHLARHYESSPHLHTLTPLTQSMQHFLKLIFELMLSSTFDMELITFAADATFTLIQIFKDYYSSLVQEILTRHSGDAQAHTRLLEAFQQLTVDQNDSNYMYTYQKKLEQFLPFVKGVLYYK